MITLRGTWVLAVLSAVILMSNVPESAGSRVVQLDKNNFATEIKKHSFALVRTTSFTFYRMKSKKVFQHAICVTGRVLRGLVWVLSGMYALSII